MHELTRTLFLMVLLVLPAASMSADTVSSSASEIRWQRAHFPPVTIPEGVHENEGFFDQVMLSLIEELPEYTHTFQIANFKRIMIEIEQQNNVCCPSLYKTEERERFVAFSIPAMVVLPNGVIACPRNRDKLLPHVDQEGRISLVSLLRDTGITVGISNGRVYSGGLDEILQSHGGRGNVVVRSGEDVFDGLMQMLQLGRVDALLGYPIEAAYWAKENQSAAEPIYYPVQESTIPLTVGYVGCPDTEWGRQVIARINTVIRERRATDFIDFYGRWLDGETREKHRKMAQSYFMSLSN